jgi:ABC-type polysaccharide/polyol phosphate export permease
VRLIAASITRDWRLARTRGPALAIDLAAVLVSAVVFFYLAKYVDHGAAYFPFVLAGLTMLRVHAAVPRILQAATGRIADGTAEILVTARSHPAVVFIGEAAFELLRGVALSVLLVVVAKAVFGADVRLTVGGLAAVAIGLAGAAAVLLALTLALLAILMVFREAGAVSSLSGVVLPVACGAYFPRSILPAPLDQITGALPFHLPVDVIRTGFVDGRFPWQDALTLVVAAAASVVIASALARPAVTHARRAGRLALE